MEPISTSILIEIAGGLAYDLLKRGAHRLTGEGLDSAEMEALGRAYEFAFRVMLEKTTAELDSDVQAHVGSLMDHFFQDNKLSHLLLSLALEKQALMDKQMPLMALREHFEHIGCDAKTLPIDLDTALESLIQGLAEGLQQESTTLFKLVGLSLLDTTPVRVHEYEKKLVDASRHRDLQNYLTAMRAYCDQLPYVSLRGKPLTHLTDVYIEQSAVNYGSDQEQKQSQRSGGYKIEPRLKSVNQAVEQHRHLIIEGGPGLGKSTLLNYLSLLLIDSSVGSESAPAIPIRVFARGLATRRRSWASSLHAQVTEELELILHNDLPLDFFAIPPFPGATWLVLIDGLDELVSPKARKKLIDTINHHARKADSFYRFVITTRPLSEIREFKQPDFAHYILRLLTPEQLPLFAKKWFSTSRGAYASDAARFLSQLEESRIADLTLIPLLLTMSAIIYERDRDNPLPAHRVDLYGRFVSTLLEEEETSRETWTAYCDEWQSRFGMRGLKWADDLFAARLQLLEHLALWRQEGNIGSLADQSISYLLKEKLLPQQVDEEWLRQQIVTLLQRTGLVALRGNEHVFIHDTFREYLAATSVARRHKPNDKGMWTLVKRWVGEGWNEVVLFLLGTWSAVGEDVTPLVYRIWKSGEGNLLLASKALAEGVCLTGDLDRDLVNALLLEVEQTKHMPSVPDYYPRALAVLGALRGRDDVAKGLLALTKAKQGNWPTEHIIVTLIRLELIDDVPSFVRQWDVGWWILPLTHRLEEVGRTEDARRILLLTAQDTKVIPDIRMRAAKGLGWAGWPDEASSILLTIAPFMDFNATQEEVVNFLDSYDKVDELRAIAEGPSMHAMMRLSATDALERRGETYDRTAVNHLIVADERSESWLRQNAARELAEQGEVNDLTRELVSSAHPSVFERPDPISVANALIEIGQVDKGLQVLTNILTDSSLMPEHKIGAAKRLGKHGQIEQATAALMSLLSNENVPPRHRVSAAEGLADLGCTPDAVQFLTRFARSSKFKLKDRICAAKLLNNIGMSREATNVLAEVAGETFSKIEDLFEVVQALGEIGQTETVAKILMIIANDNDMDPVDRLRAAKELVSFNFVDATGVLSNMMSDATIHPTIRFHAANALKTHELISDTEFASLLLTLVREAKVDSHSDRPLIRHLVYLLERQVDVDELISIAHEPQVNGWVRYYVAAAIRHSELSDEAFAAILCVARDESLDEHLRRDAIDRLEYDSRVEEMLTLLRDAGMRAWVRLWAADALQSNWFRDTTPDKDALADEVASTLVFLAHSASGEDEWVRSSAIASLTSEGRAGELFAIAGDESISKDLRLRCMSGVEELNNRRSLTKFALPELRRLASENIEIEIRSSAQNIMNALIERVLIDEEEPFSEVT